ncbi:MAG: flagellar biosynthesis anti-sigma factor FlgM [Ruminiclostridium sp.]|nr:flagellar biosynthesis anti-sigma factor FlgM [Ruminiclostridium sp.]
MRIPGDISKITGVYGQRKKAGGVGNTSSVVSKKDVLSISNQAKDFQTVFKALKDIPDIRQGKVNELSRKYDSGNYDIDGKDIIDKVIKNTFDIKA